MSQGCSFLPAGDGEAKPPLHRAFAGPPGLAKACHSASFSDDIGHVFCHHPRSRPGHPACPQCHHRPTCLAHPTCHPCTHPLKAAGTAAAGSCSLPAPARQQAPAAAGSLQQFFINKAKGADAHTSHGCRQAGYPRWCSGRAAQAAAAAQDNSGHNADRWGAHQSAPLPVQPKQQRRSSCPQPPRPFRTPAVPGSVSTSCAGHLWCSQAAASGCRPQDCWQEASVCGWPLDADWPCGHTAACAGWARWAGPAACT